MRWLGEWCFTPPCFTPYSGVQISWSVHLPQCHFQINQQDKLRPDWSVDFKLVFAHSGGKLSPEEEKLEKFAHSFSAWVIPSGQNCGPTEATELRLPDSGDDVPWTRYKLKRISPLPPPEQWTERPGCLPDLQHTLSAIACTSNLYITSFMDRNCC